MKKLCIYMLGIVLLAGCYDDEGGNDFDSVLDDVEITFPETVYSGSLGDTITVEPIVETSISENDLEYLWEVLGDQVNEYNRQTYMSLVDDSEQGKILRYVCRLDDNIGNLNTSYTCRLHIRQLSTGRDFYSEEKFTITIAGITGLMILHGDDEWSDVGVLEADEFIPSSNMIPDSPTANPAVYSGNNNGELIAGKGEAILQSIVSNYSRNQERCRIYIKTSEGALFANLSDLSFYGDWDSMFYLTGDRKVNSGNPRGYFIAGTRVAAIDGEEMYLMQQSSQYPFLFPEFTSETVCGDGNTFVLAPHILGISGSIQYLGYSDKVNGVEQKGFVGFTQLSPDNTTQYTKLLDTKSDAVAFNPGDMKADLIVMRENESDHTMAVLLGEDSHETYPNRYFAVDLYPNANSDGDSGLAGVPQYMYDLTSLTDIDNAIAFEFGETKNMCYYATSSTVYQYGVDGSTLYSATRLNMADGSDLEIEGEITMMKLLNSPNVSTHNSEPILLVATWDGNQAALYALHISTDSGKVSTAVRYDDTNVEGWDFGRIADVNIKGL